ncbi:MAG: MFS transporter [Gammaproteobacteria bacterium]|jgi:ACS family sodium-dependent inorganic phosphate cotransporter|nr:MFS transporter [Gammaproteobacteria bacterium]MAU79086.1 MFS transporter [Gammaproteobacteria bacterium]RPG27655.1 MAG: MFS transporter [Gammaproteobacteria bacterium TMED57]|tara:strand:+ start:946 stop:2235 length:1290 start_codon:yes stop_codon:yes gene_type:complete
MAELDATKEGFWRTRYSIIAMCFAATFVCYIDRVNISVAIIPMAEDYGWNLETQGYILSSFYIGYLMMQIGGGRLADTYGGKIVLGMGVLIWSLFTLITPWAAMGGLMMLYLARIGMGLGEAVTFPSVYSLVTRWFPAGETAKAIAFNASAIPIGTVFALVVTPIIVTYLGWEWAFYLFGLVGVLWFAAWQYIVSTRPQDHPQISAAELDFIKSNARFSEAAEQQQSPPIREFLKSKAVWAILVAHFCNNWTLYVILSWLPKYVNEGLGVPFGDIGYIAMLPHITSFLCLNVAGNIADRMIVSGMGVTKVRKIMQTIAFGGLAICLFLVTTVDTVWAAIGILCLGKLFGAAGIGGFNVNHMDVAPRHAGTLMGITNTAGTIPGIVGVAVTGLILEYTGSWDLVFQVTAGVTLFGMVFYLLFASGEKEFD